MKSFVDPNARDKAFPEAVTARVYKATWERFGGRGTLQLHGEILEVTNSWRVHERFSELLVFMNDLRFTEGRNGPFNFETALDWALDNVVERASLEDRLAQTVSVEFKDAPLSDILRSIRDNFGVRCTVRNDGPPNSAANELRTSLKMTAVPLRSVLQRALEPRMLDWYVDDAPVVHLIGAVEAASRRDLKVYRIKELVQAGHPADELVKRITESIDPKGWQSAGGTATIRTLPGLLLVRHNRRTQERIQEFLDKQAMPP